MSLLILSLTPKFACHRQFDGDGQVAMFGKFLLLGDNRQLGSQISKTDSTYWNNLGRCSEAIERPITKTSGRYEDLKTVPI
ncbi:MAG: hypothetical protein QNJ38_02415 [Prochloraceae cyanobacterium]|nr:hypothetical protein [Prochloraceae cyanobacterium]